ncbi:hypothetical protein Bbelb_300510 [Branchiostoma belcheri]|nr:hypothetical protein Bbelb_300510 [Branchiostoma belcheri]
MTDLFNTRQRELEDPPEARAEERSPLCRPQQVPGVRYDMGPGRHKSINVEMPSTNEVVARLYRKVDVIRSSDLSRLGGLHRQDLCTSLFIAFPLNRAGSCPGIRPTDPSLVL